MPWISQAPGDLEQDFPNHPRQSSAAAATFHFGVLFFFLVSCDPSNGCQLWPVAETRKQATHPRFTELHTLGVKGHRSESWLVVPVLIDFF